MRVGLLFSHLFDLECFSACLADEPDFVVAVATVDPTDVCKACASESLDALLIECSHKAVCPCEFAAQLVAKNEVRRILLIDREFRVTPAARALATEGFGYFTRNSSRDELPRAVRRLLAGELVIDADFAPQEVKSRRALKKGLLRFDRHGLLALSNRERQVMQLLAQGLSVGDTAKTLGLSASTVDNHRTRLRRKLNVHRPADLTRIALSEGLLVGY